jgi:hypothetical protein
MSISNAATMWRGQRLVATNTASARHVFAEAQALRDSHARAARENRRRLVAVMAVSASSINPRAFTSMNAMVSPRATMRSISPPAAA